MSVSDLTNGCKDATFTLSNLELCILQIACLDRIQNLRSFIRAADERDDGPAKKRLQVQLDQCDHLLARLVQL